MSLVGPSGSGKSSLLRAVIGLQQPLAGTVEPEVAPSEIGILFQDDALLPWKTARDNVALGLTLPRRRRGKSALAQADDWLDRLGLAGFGDRYPRHLSGGQRKRVALAQVLALTPKLLLMDEPFASLDAIVRARIVQDVAALVERERISVLLVTHDLEEAISLSDHVYLLSQGPRARITQRLSGADPAAARSGAGAHASGLRAALRQALERPVARGRTATSGRRRRNDARSALRLAPAAHRLRASLLAIWEAAGRAGLLNPLFVPTPEPASAAALVELFADGRIWPHLEATFTAALGGLALGIVVGIVLGVVAALVPLVAELLEPVMTLLNAIPRVILAPLFVIWLGIGLASKVALVLHPGGGADLLHRVQAASARSTAGWSSASSRSAADRWALVRHVYLPSVTAWVLGNLKVAVGFAFTGACVGEFVAATRGLGYLLSFAQSTYNSALMFALIFLIMVVVLVIFAAAGPARKVPAALELTR